MDELDVSKLQRVLKSHNGRQVLEALHAHGQQRGELEVEALQQVLDKLDVHVHPASLVKLLRELNRYQIGQYIIGRKGHKSRFVWNRAPGELLEMTIANTSKRETRASSAIKPVSEGPDWVIPIRAGWELRLPRDVTREEAAFIRSYLERLGL